MRKSGAFLLAFAFAVPFMLAAFIAPVAGAQSQRGDRQQQCTQQYQACGCAADANEATCGQAFDACCDGCKDVRGNTNANDNTNDNTNGDMNSNGNMNAGDQSGVRRGRNSSPSTPRAPVNRNANERL